ncbi:unnamed protein product, partial [Ectocarpus sp. 13 AM-2016]
GELPLVTSCSGGFRRVHAVGNAVYRHDANDEVLLYHRFRGANDIDLIPGNPVRQNEYLHSLHLDLFLRNSDKLVAFGGEGGIVRHKAVLSPYRPNLSIIQSVKHLSFFSWATTVYQSSL